MRKRRALLRDYRAVLRDYRALLENVGAFERFQGFLYVEHPSSEYRALLIECGALLRECRALLKLSITQKNPMFSEYPFGGSMHSYIVCVLKSAGS